MATALPWPWHDGYGHISRELVMVFDQYQRGTPCFRIIRIALVSKQKLGKGLSPVFWKTKLLLKKWSSKFGHVKFYFIPWLAKLDNTDVSGRGDVLPIFALQGLSSGVKDFTDDFNVRHVASMTSNPNRSWCWIQFCLVRVKKLQQKFLVIIVELRSRNATSLPLMSLSF